MYSGEGDLKAEDVDEALLHNQQQHRIVQFKIIDVIQILLGSEIYCMILGYIRYSLTG